MEGLYKSPPSPIGLRWAGKYKIESTRLAGWDYGAGGFYFITICAKNRGKFFGDVLVDNDSIASVALSGIGKIARDCWMEIPKHFSDASSDEWIIMPNHVHGIIQICENQPHNEMVETQHAASLQNKKPSRTFYRLQPESLPVIIRSFKSAVTNECHNHRFNFMWQPRYYDHIVRTESALQKIRAYIKNNPQMWPRDRNNPEGLIM